MLPVCNVVKMALHDLIDLSPALGTLLTSITIKILTDTDRSLGGPLKDLAK